MLKRLIRRWWPRKHLFRLSQQFQVHGRAISIHRCDLCGHEVSGLYSWQLRTLPVSMARCQDPNAPVFQLREMVLAKGVDCFPYPRLMVIDGYVPQRTPELH